MRAVVIRRPGGPEVLDFEEVDDAVAGSGEIVVRVRATALNRADLLQRLGIYPPPEEAPENIPGLEFAGEVLAVADDVSGTGIGDTVMGIVGGGGHAQQVAVAAAHCLPLPPDLDPTRGAAIPEAFITAFDALVLQAGLAAGEGLLVHAAGSGVGNAALQLGKSVGARTVGLTRSPDKCRRLTDWGADGTVDACRADWVSEVNRVSDGGIDVVLDLVGGRALAGNISLLRPGGRLITLGLLGGACGEIDLFTVMRKRLHLTGSTLRYRSREEKAATVHAFSLYALPRIAAGELKPCIDSVLPWTEVRAAHDRMEHNANFGKIVLEVD